MRRLLLLVALAAGCGGRAPAAPPATSVATPSDSGAALSVLFVGNSLTESNDLAGRVQEIGRAAGLDLDTEAVVRGGYSLEDHWREGRVRQAIASRRWTFVVLQQGPSTLPESRANLIQWARVFAEATREVGGRPALLMVWPMPGQRTEAVAASYRAAAEAVDGVLVPAGEAWVRASAAVPGLRLTVSDGFHPSSAGTEIAAVTAVCSLFPGTRPVPDVEGGEAARDAVVRAACP